MKLGDLDSLAVCDDDAQAVTVLVASAAVALTHLDEIGDTEVHAVSLGSDEAENSDDTVTEAKPDGDMLTETTEDAVMDTDPRTLGLTDDVFELVDDAELHRVERRVVVCAGEPVATRVTPALELVTGVPVILMVDDTQLVPSAVCVCVWQADDVDEISLDFVGIAESVLDGVREGSTAEGLEEDEGENDVAEESEMVDDAVVDSVRRSEDEALNELVADTVTERLDDGDSVAGAVLEPVPLSVADAVYDGVFEELAEPEIETVAEAVVDAESNPIVADPEVLE